MTGSFQHDVVVMTIADSEYVSSDAVAGARSREILDCSLVLQFGGIVLGEPFGYRTILERAGQTEFHLYLSQGFRIRYHLDYTAFVAGRNACECYHFQIKAFLQPEFIHYSYHLQSQHVLLQIVADLRKIKKFV